MSGGVGSQIVAGQRGSRRRGERTVQNAHVVQVALRHMEEVIWGDNWTKKMGQVMAF